MGRLAMARGRFDEAAERLQPLAPLAERAVDIQFVGPVRASLAELALWQGRPDDAAAQVAAAIRLVDFTPEVKIGEVYALGLRANADAAERARARRSPEQVAPGRPGGEELLEAMRGRHADVVARRPAFEQLSEAWVRCARPRRSACTGAPTPTPGSPVSSRGSGSGARTWSRMPAGGRRRRVSPRVAIAAWPRRRCGLRSTPLNGSRAEPLAREVTALAARARLSLEPAEGAGPSDAAEDARSRVPDDDAARLGLTPREREVLALVALGRTNRQIADELFISENTAGVHVSNILGKLEVTGRGEAAAVAYRLGLVEAARERR